MVGYADLGGRPAFKLALQVGDERWYLFAAHLWHRGWSVIDVTEPREPVVVTEIPDRRTHGPSRSTWLMA